MNVKRYSFFGKVVVVQDKDLVNPTYRVSLEQLFFTTFMILKIKFLLFIGNKRNERAAILVNLNLKYLN